MNPVEQHEALSEITLALVDELPPGWQRIVVEYAVADGQDSLGAACGW